MALALAQAAAGSAREAVHVRMKQLVAPTDVTVPMRHKRALSGKPATGVPEGVPVRISALELAAAGRCPEHSVADSSGTGSRGAHRPRARTRAARPPRLRTPCTPLPCAAGSNRGSPVTDPRLGRLCGARATPPVRPARRSSQASRPASTGLRRCGATAGRMWQCPDLRSTQVSRAASPRRAFPQNRASVLASSLRMVGSMQKSRAESRHCWIHAQLRPSRRGRPAGPRLPLRVHRVPKQEQRSCGELGDNPALFASGAGAVRRVDRRPDDPAEITGRHLSGCVTFSQRLCHVFAGEP
jgi:hypothetical protein